ncbi:hypothetical protein JTE90_002897 [Oedothorax gibbosus]|uniref:Uncharacterized protein n=1 Tax=Oedothorax gibbosus TaxID=931172 RepID=A0AAV6UA66_9ARAC|nr:hypothetical protein JTE90_002897 [Oedothorax gibbosus]
MSTKDSLETIPVGRSSERKLSPGRKSLNAELYGLGRTMKHPQPRDKETGIFDAFRLPPPDKNTLIRKINNYSESQVFAPAQTLPPRPQTPMELTTKYKLFIKPPPKIKVKKDDRMIKSSAFDVEDRIMLPRFYVKKDPITGEDGNAKITKKRQNQLKLRNPITFEGIAENRFPNRNMQPPGGTSSISLEYIE